MAGCVGYEVGCVGSSVVFVLELCGEQPRAEPALGVGCALGWWWGAVEWGLHYLKEIIFFWVGGGDGQSRKWEERAPPGGGEEGELPEWGAPLLGGRGLSFLPALGSPPWVGRVSSPEWGAPLLGGGELPS